MYFDCVGQTPDQAGLLVVGWLSRRLGPVFSTAFTMGTTTAFHALARCRPDFLRLGVAAGPWGLLGHGYRVSFPCHCDACPSPLLRGTGMVVMDTPVAPVTAP